MVSAKTMWVSHVSLVNHCACKLIGSAQKNWRLHLQRGRNHIRTSFDCFPLSWVLSFVLSTCQFQSVIDFPFFVGTLSTFSAFFWHKLKPWQHGKDAAAAGACEKATASEACEDSSWMGAMSAHEAHQFGKTGQAHPVLTAIRVRLGFAIGQEIETCSPSTSKIAIQFRRWQLKREDCQVFNS